MFYSTLGEFEEASAGNHRQSATHSEVRLGSWMPYCSHHILWFICGLCRLLSCNMVGLGSTKTPLCATLYDVCMYIAPFR